MVPAHNSQGSVNNNEEKTNEMLVGNILYEPSYFRKMYVASLRQGETEEVVKEYFSKWGEVTEIIFAKQNLQNQAQTSTKTRQFAFITFKTSLAVDKIQENRPHKLHGHIIITKRFIPKQILQSCPENKFQTDRLYLPGLLEKTTEQDIRTYFAQTKCNVTKVRLIKSPKHESSKAPQSQCAVVTFQDYDEVDKLLLIQCHTICGKSISVRRARDDTKGNGSLYSIPCVCGSLLPWGGPNSGVNYHEVMHSCTCGAMQNYLPNSNYMSGNYRFSLGYSQNKRGYGPRNSKYVNGQQSKKTSLSPSKSQTNSPPVYNNIVGEGKVTSKQCSDSQ